MMNCTTHHHACDCREHKIAMLMKAAMDAATALDWTKNNPAVDVEQRAENLSAVERVQAACDALNDPAAPFCPRCGLHRPCLCMSPETEEVMARALAKAIFHSRSSGALPEEDTHL